MSKSRNIADLGSNDVLETSADGITVTGEVSTTDLTVTNTITGSVSDISNHDTDDLTEGATNQYFTEARVLAALSASDGITFNSGTGEFTLTDSGVTADTYGSASEVPVLTIDANGRVTSATTTNVAGVSTFTYDSVNETLTITTADGGSFSVDVSSLASESFVNTIVSNLVDSAPTTLDTLNELAAAINDDANFAATVTAALGTKVDKIDITGATVGSSTAIPVITYNTQGQITSASETGITVGDGQFTVSTGSGISGGGILGTANQTGNTSVTISHADTSTQASVNNSGNTFVQDITLDGFGHITGIASGTVTVGDATITIDAGTDLETGGNFTTNQGTNETITIDHSAVGRSDTTSTQTATHEGTVSVVDGITTSPTGHVTGVNVKTVTLPAGAVPNDATITVAAGTDLATGGNFTTDQGTNETITLNHANITRTDTTSSTSATFGGTIDVVNSVTTNARGHVTAVDIETITLPSEADTLDTVTDRGNTTTNDITVGSITTTGYIRGPATFTIDPAAHGDDTGTVVIAGNLQVDGTTTTINSTTVTIDDKTLVLADNATTDTEANGSAVVFGGQTDAASIYYNSTNDRIGVANVNGIEATNFYGNLTGNISGDADTVDGLHASQFLRSDANDTFTGLLSLGNASSRIDGSDTFPLVQVNSSRAYFGSTSRAKTVLASSDTIKHVRGGTEYEIWTAYNDGSGSGLDADTVDGLHASQFLRSDTSDTMTGDLTISGNVTASASSYINGDNNRLRVGGGGGGKSVTIGNTMTSNGSSLSYGGYIAYDCYFDGTDWAADRTTLSRKWMTHVGGYHDNSFNINYYDGDASTPWATTAWSRLFTLDASGNGTFAGNVTAPIFYDSNNTGYYLDPASTSNLNTLNVGTINRNPTVTLSGDVTGSATMTNLGSINITATVGNDSHQHSYIKAGGDGPSTEDLNSVANSVGVGRLSYRGYNVSSTNKPPAYDNANGVITVGQHTGSYTAQLAFSSDGKMYHRDNPAGVHGSWQGVFTDAYHPNADKWTTARTLSLTGDVTGSVSWDGSGNASLTTTVANDSHSHSNYVTSNAADTMTGRFDNTVGITSRSIDIATTGDRTIQGLASHNTIGSYGDLHLQHYGGDLHTVHGGGTLYANGNTVWHAGNDGAGSGLDADLLDGLHANQFTRKYEFNIGSSSGSRRYIRLWTMTDHDDGVIGMLAGGGDYGDPTRETYQLNVGTRSGSCDASVFKTSYGSVADSFSFYKRDIGSSYEIWMLAADYNYNGMTAFIPYSDHGIITYQFDSITTTAPSDLVAFSTHTMFHTGNDGSGSGLDADLLDGTHLSAITHSGDSVSLTGDVTGSTTVASDGSISLSTEVLTPEAGDWWNGGYTKVGTDGVMEIGKYIDWHDTDAETSDYSARLTNSGAHLYASGRLYANSNQRVFADDYHPNADKWTTARTLSLTGDVTGSVSWDGSGNASLSATVANDSHSHSNYLPLSGGTMTGDFVTTSGNGNGVYIGSGGANITSVTPSSKDIVVQDCAQFRMGGADWDWNVWAGWAWAGGTNPIYFGGPASSAFSANSNPPVPPLLLSGVSYTQSDGSMRAPIFYDSANTGYYWNPNSGSAHRFQTPNGYVHIGPMNASHCHFDTDRSNFYFNREIRVNSGIIGSYDEDLDLRRAGSTTARIRVTSGTTINDQNFSTAGKRMDIASSANWDEVGFTKQTNLHFQGHNQFWIGAGNGTWFAGTANTKNQATGMASDVSRAHDLLITTMQSTSTYDRGITFAVDNTGAGTSGWRLGKWHSGTGRASSMLAVDGQIVAKGGATDFYDYYGNDYSTYYNSGKASWNGDGGWHKPSIVAANAIQIQAGNGSTSATKPQIQFHQYGYGGPIIEYSGPDKRIEIRETGSSDRFTYLNVVGQVRGDIYYDRNNTGYYVDPASTSNIVSMRMKGNLSFDNYGLGPIGYYTSTRLQNVFAMDDQYKISDDGSSVGNHYGIVWSHSNAGSLGGANNLAGHGMILLTAGVYDGSWGEGRLDTTSQIRAPIYYDRNNTSYYVDPASTSNLNALNVGGYAVLTTNSTITVSGYLPLSGGTITGDLTVQGTLYETSDASIKENVQPIEGALDKVTKLRGVSFNKIGFSHTELGFIAQEVEPIVPELVTGDEDGIKKVSYSRTVALLVEANKELNAKVDSQQAQIDELKQLVQQLLNK